MSSTKRWPRGVNKQRSRARTLLERQGIRLLRLQELDAMTAELCQHLADGAFGSCCKTRDPQSQESLVIKTFRLEHLNHLVMEATSLRQLQENGVQRQENGVQRLVGVCVETCQLVTYFAGETSEHYFTDFHPFAHVLGVFLQVAQTLQEIHRKGFVHNDIKGDNICVITDNKGPIATIIDFGLASVAGTWGVYCTAYPKHYPWLAPELLENTHPSSEASDVFGLAFMMKEVLCLEEGFSYPHSLGPLVCWLQDAARSNPAERPGLAYLVEVLEVLFKEAKNSMTSGNASIQDEDECT